MKLLDDIKAFVTKNNILCIAVAIALGFAINGFVNATFSHLIEPLLNMITGGKGLQVMNMTYLEFGSFLLAVIRFAFIVGVLYVVFGCIWKCDGSAPERKESAPPPPPPAPPV